MELPALGLIVPLCRCIFILSIIFLPPKRLPLKFFVLWFYWSSTTKFFPPFYVWGKAAFDFKRRFYHV